MDGEAPIQGVAGVAIEKVHESGDGNLLVQLLCRGRKNADARFRGLRRKKSAGRILERRADIVAGSSRGLQPGALARRRVEVEEGLPHGERVANERSAAILRVMAEAAALDPAVGLDPMGGPFGDL